MQLAACFLSAIPLRKEPAHRSEMVSQLLFGEYAEPGELKDDFVHVTCRHDGYTGWVQASQLQQVTEREVYETNSYTASFSTPVVVNNTLHQVPYATPVFQETKFSAFNGLLQYLMQPQQVWHSNQQKLTVDALTAACQPFINAPYLWGGRSVFGVDCSGFVQQVFKLFGVKLLRDAYLQAEGGTAVVSVNEARPGDLLFFCNEAGKVTHVGILLPDNKIIHASGRVRIDQLTSTGITNLETGKQTHTLHSIRRMINA